MGLTGRFDRLVYYSSAAFLSLAIVVFWGSNNWRLGWLSLISGLFGFIVKYWEFSFVSAFRSFSDNEDLSMWRAILWMLFIGTGLCSLFETLSKLHPLFFWEKGLQFLDSARSVGTSVVFGSFLFGVGMQLCSVCSLGALVGVGEGFIKSMFALPFFVIGSTLATINPIYNWYSSLPCAREVIRIDFGFMQMILMFLYALTFLYDRIRAKYFGLESLSSGEFLLGGETENQQPVVNQDRLKWYRLTLVAISLGIIISAFYLCNGTMFDIIGVFPMVGASILKLFGAAPEKWNYFKGKAIPTNYLDNAVFDSNLFIIVGAFVASAARENYGKKQQKGSAEILKAIIGGLIMGIGGQMANGCTISALTSGITSSSLSGLVWMVCAICGSFVVCQLELLYKKFSPLPQQENPDAVAYT